MVLALLLSLALPLAHAELAEGTDYVRLSPAQPQTTSGKIEVIEFFSYGCPHCYHLHPLITKWQAELPANAVLIKVPVSLGRREWGQLSRAYYALEATGDLARLDAALFDAIHKEGLPLYDEESISAWLAGQGVDVARFRAQFNSQAVSAKALRAEQMSRDYKITGIPSLSVAGKYQALGKTFPDVLKSTRALIDKLAGEKPQGSP
jgi:thiol:disulfide interchange protein DsbA